MPDAAAVTAPERITITADDAAAEIGRLLEACRRRGLVGELAQREASRQLSERAKAAHAAARVKPGVSAIAIDRHAVTVFQQARRSSLNEAARLLLQAEADWSNADVVARYRDTAAPLATGMTIGDGYNALKHVAQMRSRGVSITLDGPEIVVSPASMLNERDRHLLRSHRERIVAALEDEEIF